MNKIYFFIGAIIIALLAWCGWGEYRYNKGYTQAQTDIIVKNSEETNALNKRINELLNQNKQLSKELKNNQEIINFLRLQFPQELKDCWKVNSCFEVIK